jgi:hypothetical protein
MNYHLYRGKRLEGLFTFTFTLGAIWLPHHARDAQYESPAAIHAAQVPFRAVVTGGVDEGLSTDLQVLIADPPGRVGIISSRVVLHQPTKAAGRQVSLGALSPCPRSVPKNIVTYTSK